MKKKIAIVFGAIVIIAAILFMIRTVNRNKVLNNQTQKVAQKLLKREKTGKLENTNVEDGEVAQDGIQALIKLERYDDAKRILKKYIAIYPKGITWVTYYTDMLKQQEKWDELASVIVAYLTDNWKVANITTEQFALYTDLKDTIGKLKGETKKKADELVKEAEQNIQTYKILQNDQKAGDLSKDQKVLESLKKAGADNEVFFEIYMEYLLQTDQKDTAKSYLSEYERREQAKDATLTYSIESEKVSEWKKALS